VVRIAPLGELKAYLVSESELETLARGSSELIFLNFALALLPISLTLVVTLWTTTISSERLYQGFLIVATITFLAGLILLVLWWRSHVSSRTLVARIKNRMPSFPGIQEPPALPGEPSPPPL
jgi:hypothetical protein